MRQSSPIRTLLATYLSGMALCRLVFLSSFVLTIVDGHQWSSCVGQATQGGAKRIRGKNVDREEAGGEEASDGTLERVEETCKNISVQMLLSIPLGRSLRHCIRQPKILDTSQPIRMTQRGITTDVGKRNKCQQ